MRVLVVRNAHEALPLAIDILRKEGVYRPSRNGPVLVLPEPMTTVYSHPTEKLVFWEGRDYNPAFVVYEALWMLDGRCDLEPLTHYIKDFGRYSDNGTTLHGAYGHRWRVFFGFDQLGVIAQELEINPDSRRCVLQIWSACDDLGIVTKDAPCNDMATFQINPETGKLDMTVFCRSNDVIWGAYYANAYHFGLLLEYMAQQIGVDVGVYRQVSVNWHAYVDVIDKLEFTESPDWNPYPDLMAVKLPKHPDRYIKELLLHDGDSTSYDEELWYRVNRSILKAHRIWRTTKRHELALRELEGTQIDLIVSMRAWLERRARRWKEKECIQLNAR